VLADVVNGEDIRVIQRAGGPRLALEARDPGRIAGGGQRERLDRHLAVIRGSCACQTSPIPPAPIRAMIR